MSSQKKYTTERKKDTSDYVNLNQKGSKKPSV